MAISDDDLDVEWLYMMCEKGLMKMPTEAKEDEFVDEVKSRIALGSSVNTARITAFAKVMV